MAAMTAQTRAPGTGPQRHRAPGARALEVGMVQPTVGALRRRFPRGDRRLARQLPALRAELERQRDFRDEQLAHLVAHEHTHTALIGYGPRAADPDAARALREVRATVATGARQALADIELALRRIRTGQYGRCRACGADIPLAVLTAIPKSTLCVTCHWRQADSSHTVTTNPTLTGPTAGFQSGPAISRRRSSRAQRS
jgi:RNA polymerase-binding transcription factor DksA